MSQASVKLFQDKAENLHFILLNSKITLANTFECLISRWNNDAGKFEYKDNM